MRPVAPTSPGKLFEITLAIGLFAFLNRFSDSIWIDLDDGAPRGAHLYIEPDRFQSYARGMYHEMSDLQHA